MQADLVIYKLFVFVLLSAVNAGLFGIMGAIALGWPLWTCFLIGGAVSAVLLALAPKVDGPRVCELHSGGEWVPMEDDERIGGFLANPDGTPWDGSGPCIEM